MSEVIFVVKSTFGKAIRATEIQLNKMKQNSFISVLFQTAANMKRNWDKKKLNQSINQSIYIAQRHDVSNALKQLW